MKKELCIEISYNFDHFEPPEHYCYVHSIDDAIEALLKLKEELKNEI